MSEVSGYRIEGERGSGWVIIRNHDDEIVAFYDTKAEAIKALKTN